MPGDRSASHVDGVRIFMEDGPGPTTVGIGFLVNLSDGPCTITADGSMTIFTVGFGFPTMSGVQRGSSGDMVTTMLGGRPFPRTRISAFPSAFGLRRGGLPRGATGHSRTAGTSAHPRSPATSSTARTPDD